MTLYCTYVQEDQSETKSEETSPEPSQKRNQLIPSNLTTLLCDYMHTEDDSADDEILHNSLAIFFESGEVPFVELITSLANDKNLAWHLVMRDEQKRALFRIKKAFDVTLISQLGYLELRVAMAGYTELLLPEICIQVYNTIEMKAEHLKWKNFHLAFKCTCSQTPDIHLMKVDSLISQPTRAECLYLPLDQQLSKDHLIWFVSAKMHVLLAINWQCLVKVPLVSR